MTSFRPAVAAARLRALFDAPLALACLLGATLAACPPNYPKCSENKHCESKGEICVEGLCKQCGTDTDCKEGFRCVENACVPLPQCRIDTDCTDGLKCRADRCVPECSRDTECGSDEKCRAGRCVDRAACSSDGDCADADHCVANRCEPKESADAGTVTGPLTDAEVEKRKRLEACVLERIQFDFNGFGLTDQARASLDRSAECIRFKGRGVVIAGHADERGTEEYNLVLGEKRANAVKRYLAGLGLDENKLRTVSYGEYRPVDGAQTEDAWSMNRRAELAFE